jgi:hypothetical protein
MVTQISSQQPSLPSTKVLAAVRFRPPLAAQNPTFVAGFAVCGFLASVAPCGSPGSCTARPVRRSPGAASVWPTPSGDGREKEAGRKSGYR